MISALAQVDWSDVYNCVDASEAYWLFSCELANIYTVSVHIVHFIINVKWLTFLRHRV